ncbi:hypothetical protein GPALN_016275 [Globodera pallida]|nr:hypothetical protein GPALN_016275 [Globodera pallida]
MRPWGVDELDPPDAHHRPMTAPAQHFLGEEWRACCGGRLHIVQAARIVVVADLAKLVAESAYFVAHIGYLDAMCCLQLSWSLLGVSIAIPALLSQGQRRHRHLLPLISLKAVECAVCVLVLLLIFSLGVSGPIGYSALRWLIRWKYRRIEDKDALTFSLATFLVVALLPRRQLLRSLYHLPTEGLFAPEGVASVLAAP